MASRKGVLVVGSFVSNNSLSRYVGGALSERLAANGWITTVTSRKAHRVWRLFDMLKTVWRKRGSYSVAVVEVYSGPAFFWAESVCRLLRRLGKPYVLALHGGNLPEFARSQPARVRALLRSVPIVVSPSGYLIEELACLGIGVQLLPNPVSAVCYPFRVRRQLQPNLIWLRAFHAIYNPSLLPKAMARLTTEMPDLHATMIGPDKADGSFQLVRQCACDLGLSNRVTVIPGVPHEEVPEWLDRADIFVSTTNFDNTPVSVIEAMACGLPIVSTNVGGVSHLLRHGDTGLLVPANDPEAMASAIKRLFADPNLAERLSVGGRKQAEQYDWSVILPKWEALLSASLPSSCSDDRGTRDAGRSRRRQEGCPGPRV